MSCVYHSTRFAVRLIRLIAYEKDGNASIAPALLSCRSGERRQSRDAATVRAVDQVDGLDHGVGARVVPLLGVGDRCLAHAWVVLSVGS